MGISLIPNSDHITRRVLAHAGSRGWWPVMDRLSFEAVREIVEDHECTSVEQALNVFSVIMPAWLAVHEAIDTVEQITATGDKPVTVARTQRRARVAVLLVGLAVVLATLLGMSWHSNGVPPLVCPSEDSVGCVWFGPLQANNDGNIVISFTEHTYFVIGV